MIINGQKINNDQLFIIISFVLSLALCFMFAFAAFRFWFVDFYKSDVKQVNFDTICK
jgi:hypothetical protein